MPAFSNSKNVALLALLCTCMALGHNLKSHHDTSANYATVLHELSTAEADAGAGLEDAKMTSLTHSIQGVFDMNPGPKPTIVENRIEQAVKLHLDASLVNQSQLKDKNKTKTAVEEASSSMPMASFALEPKPKPFGSSTEDKISDNSTQQVSEEKKAKSLEEEAGPSNVGLANASASVKKIGKLPIEGKVGHINVSSVAHPMKRMPELVNQTQVNRNKTKAIEEAAVSLPMASFALEESQPVKNKTEPKFPGNASQKAAWDKKEASLEKEVEKLKHRLANASESLATTGRPAKSAATGTFNAQAHTSDGKQSNGFMSANGPETKQQSINKAMGTAFTVLPAKKVESVISLDAIVEHDAVPSDDESQGRADQTPAVAWFSSIFSWLTGGTSIPVAPHATPVAPLVVPTHKKVWVKQDSERTAQATREENLNVIQLNDAWSQMEEEDAAKQESVRREDLSERARAETPEVPHTPSQAELQGRLGVHGVEMSSFWGRLENEDNTLEQTVSSDDIVKYTQMTDAQDKRVAQAADELDSNQLTMGHSFHSNSHNSDARLAIHDPWLRRELKDKALERQIHDSPELQMLQLQHHHRRK